MKYIIGGFGIIVVVAAFIALIVTFVGRGPVPDSEKPEDTIVLRELADESSEVTFVTSGRIVADEEFETIRITVSDSRRRFEILRGYNLTVEERADLPNTTAAYEAFLYALANAGFNSVLEGESTSEKGKCPTNRRHTYRLHIDGEEAIRSWSSPCRGERGNFGGDARLVERLFQAQIPEYRERTRGMSI